MSPALKQTLEECAGFFATVVVIGLAFYIGDVFEALSKRIAGGRKRGKR